MSAPQTHDMDIRTAKRTASHRSQRDVANHLRHPDVHKHLGNDEPRHLPGRTVVGRRARRVPRRPPLVRRDRGEREPHADGGLHDQREERHDVHARVVLRDVDDRLEQDCRERYAGSVPKVGEYRDDGDDREYDRGHCGGVDTR